MYVTSSTWFWRVVILVLWSYMFECDTALWLSDFMIRLVCLTWLMFHILATVRLAVWWAVVLMWAWWLHLVTQNKQEISLTELSCKLYSHRLKQTTIYINLTLFCICFYSLYMSIAFLFKAWLSSWFARAASVTPCPFKEIQVIFFVFSLSNFLLPSILVSNS